MRDPAGKPSNGLHLLRETKLFLKTLAIAYVSNSDDDTCGIIVRIFEWGTPDRRLEQRVVFSPFCRLQPLDDLASKSAFENTRRMLLITSIREWYTPAQTSVALQPRMRSAIRFHVVTQPCLSNAKMAKGDA